MSGNDKNTTSGRIKDSYKRILANRNRNRTLKTLGMAAIMGIGSHSFCNAQVSEAEDSVPKTLTGIVKDDTISKNKDVKTFEFTPDMFTDSIEADPILNILQQKENNLNEAKNLMLYVIAHFEGVKCKAYWDPHGKVWTIGIGNTVRPDGKRVTAKDRIRTEEEALAYVDTHVDKHMSQDMMAYLPLDKMSKEEIAVMGSLLYNCGTGILRDRNKKPTEFAKLANEYFLTHDPEVAKQFDDKYRSYCTAKKVVNKTLKERRNSELAFIHGDVSITIDDTVDTSKNVINLRKAVLGTLYGCGANPDKIMERFSEESRYYCPTDSVKVAIDKALATPVRNTTRNMSKVANRGCNR